MNPQVQVLEELTLVAPFGVRFWDITAMAPAGAGLTVIAYPNGFPSLRSTAYVNHTGVYFFHNLPGMRRVENGSGDDNFWIANPPSIPFTIEVSDSQDRYLPYQFSVLLPMHGLYGLATSPLSSLTPDSTWLPMFSTPSRPLPGPSAVVRALLKDDVAKAPAAWALVTAQISGSLVMTGLGDNRGALSLTLPYPEPQNSPFASPLGPGSLQLSDQTWPLNISVFYVPKPAGQVLPDLVGVLHQGAANVWRDTAHSGPANSFTLQFGKELVLRSLDSGTGRELPVLLVTP
ncbi:MAG TPA: hypothetical protein VHA33_06835 [Candidatus Angelobacter sp.]|jgi:hypothetical protein|nr:hypothetical protein [Candidatus Angelobacter sp.]